MQESGEMYLETIYILSREKGTVRSVDVSEKIGFSKPSVSRAMGLLKKDGQIEIDGSGLITLTAAGLKRAKGVYERHIILTAALKSLGVDEKTADEDACRVEHYISDKTFTAIKKHLKKMGTLPKV